jgi:hypothetical protein
MAHWLHYGVVNRPQVDEQNAGDQAYTAMTGNVQGAARLALEGEGSVIATLLIASYAYSTRVTSRFSL